MVDFRSQQQGQLAILESLWTLYPPQIKSINRNTCTRTAIVIIEALFGREGHLGLLGSGAEVPSEYLQSCGIPNFESQTKLMVWALIGLRGE